tara:strand:- start:586 stop:732 length:147 start_codon:yes stop_codon:yes gene_type:complete
LSSFLCLIVIERARIDGTQIPTKIPASLSPENHKNTENKKEIKARIIG